METAGETRSDWRNRSPSDMKAPDLHDVGSSECLPGVDVLYSDSVRGEKSHWSDQRCSNSFESIEASMSTPRNMKKPQGWGYWLVIPEDRRGRILWHMILALLLVYTGTIFPYRLCFVELSIVQGDPQSQFWDVVEGIVDGLFYIDLVVNFFFTFLDKDGHEVTDLRRIALRYLHTYFVLNFIACIPPELIGFFVSLFSSSGDDAGTINKSARLSRLQRISRLARLTRLTRLTKLFSFIMQNQVWSWIQEIRGIRVVNFIFGLFWSVHLVACGWYLCATMHADSEDTWVFRRGILHSGPLEQWFHANYFVLTVFTTVGFGDISANTVGEIGYVMFTMVIGAVVHSIIMSEVINIVMTVDQVAQGRSDQKELVGHFTHHVDLEKNVEKDIMKFFNHARIHNMKFEKDKMRSLITNSPMPRDLMASLIGGLFKGHLEHNQFITNCLRYEKRMPPRFPLLVALAVHQRHFHTKEMVYCAYDHPWSLFLVFEGTFSNLAFATLRGGVSDLPPEVIGIAGKPSSSALAPKNASTSSGPPTKMARRTSWRVDEAQRQSDLYPYQLFGRGSYFGDLELLSHLGQQSRCTSTRCESDKGGVLLVLHKTDLSKLVKDFPRFSIAWRSKARRREDHRQKLVRKLQKGQGFQDLAASMIQGYVRQFFFGQTLPEPSIIPVGYRQSSSGLNMSAQALSCNRSLKDSFQSNAVDSTQHAAQFQQHSTQQAAQFQQLRNEMMSELKNIRKELLETVQRGQVAAQASGSSVASDRVCRFVALAEAGMTSCPCCGSTVSVGAQNVSIPSLRETQTSSGSSAPVAVASSDPTGSTSVVDAGSVGIQRKTSVTFADEAELAAERRQFQM